MVNVIFKCSNCGHGEGKIWVNIHFETYVECLKCEESEKLPDYGYGRDVIYK
jgi:hypothetical protein